MSETTTHLLDTETWGDRELLEVICSRYFLLGGQGVSELSWEVNGRDGIDPSECLVSLNRHLKSLSLIAVLDEGNPPIMSIGSLPTQPVVMPSWQQSLVWLLAASFTTLSGSLWISSMEPGQQPFDSNILETAIVFFTLPVLGSVLLASYARIFVAKAFEVENSHLIPLAFPVFSPEWPFSLVSAIGQNRTDLHPIPNRRALGMIELTTPAVMFFCGTLLTVIGLGLTSVQPPLYESSPVSVDLNLISEVLSSILVEPHATLRLQWIHPTGLAGIALSIVGWALLLPIPGFPGDRILHSIVGPRDMQDDRNQTSIFISTLGIVILIFISTEYWPWLLLAAIAAWRRFSPEQMPEPFVVDEYASLDEIPMRQIATLTIAILLLGYPGLEPSSQIDDWDEGLLTENWPVSMTFEGGIVQLQLPLEPEGIMPVSGWLQMRIEGANDAGWQVNSECLDERGVCRFDDITQASPDSVQIELSRDTNQTSNLTFRLLVLIDVDGHISEHSVLFRAADATSSVDPLWIMVEDTSTPRICVELSVSKGDHVNLSIQNPFWSFENETSLAEDTHDLCLRGQVGAIQSLPERDDQHLVVGPQITLHRENQSEEILLMSIENTLPSLHVSGDEWPIPEWFGPQEGYTIVRGESGSVFCPSSSAIADVDTGENWSRDLADRSAIAISESGPGNGTLRFSTSGWLAVCDGTTLLSAYQVIEGPDVVVESSALNSQLSEGELRILNRENTTFSISVDWVGDAVTWDNWGVSHPSEIAPNSQALVTISVEETNAAIWTSWISVEDEEITLHFSARSTGVAE
ncbi:MAG: hypothetical protein VYC60_01870 [Candidatus Thermoplasmatota archaeon]|nr:hypothetical protein [Candidatus Thermoplasmatota archaeon]|tara:strand:- start:1021 stop:3438 length:2418 start_codon:yes stop_codon:yes gene_type:complete